MLEDKAAKVIHELIMIAEELIIESGGCDHPVGICFCGVQSTIIDAYEVLHSNGVDEHIWIRDYDWDSADVPTPILRCEKCFAEKLKV